MCSPLPTHPPRQISNSPHEGPAAPRARHAQTTPRPQRTSQPRAVQLPSLRVRAPRRTPSAALPPPRRHPLPRPQQASSRSCWRPGAFRAGASARGLCTAATTRGLELRARVFLWPLRSWTQRPPAAAPWPHPPLFLHMGCSRRAPERLARGLRAVGAGGEACQHPRARGFININSCSLQARARRPRLQESAERRELVPVRKKSFDPGL